MLVQQLSYISEEFHNIISLSHIRQEYPVYGTSDYRQPAIEICQTNGSKISDFHYQSHSISNGKPKLENLPATYTENDDEALTFNYSFTRPCNFS